VITLILNIVSSLFTVAGKLFDYLYAKQLTDAGKAEQKVAELREQVANAHRALQVRIIAERLANNDPDGVSDDDDGFKRSD
jgi:hypothetical protein